MITMEVNNRLVAVDLITFLVLCSLVLGFASADIGTSRKSLVKHLLGDYDKRLRPVCVSDDAVTVDVGITVKQIIELDEPSQTLNINIWVMMAWNDCQLRWNVSDYDGIGNVVLPITELWSPDISLYDNLNDEGLGGRDRYLVNVANTGDLFYIYPAIIQVTCDIDVTYFPFDQQTCRLMFGSWSYHGKELDIISSVSSADMSVFWPSQEWDLVAVPAERHLVMYDCCPESYPDVTFSVILRRKPLFYIVSIVLPCVVITLISVFGFILPVESGEKLSLQITVLLALSVFLLMVTEQMQASSQNFPYLGWYFAATFTLVSISTLLSTVVIYFHHRGEQQPGRAPECLRNLVFGCLAKLVCSAGIDAFDNFRSSADNQNLDVLSADNQNLDVLGADNKGYESDASVPGKYIVTPNLEPESTNVLVNLKNILDRLVVTMEKHDTMSLEQEVADEWKRLSFIIDRVCLVVSAVLSFVATIVFILLLYLKPY